MDNYKLHITAEGDGTLQKVLELLTLTDKKIAGYSIVPGKGIQFYWTAGAVKPPNYFTPLPHAMKPIHAFELIKGWWNENEVMEPVDSGFDGSTGKGFEIGTEVIDERAIPWSAFFFIRPIATYYNQ